MSEKHFTTCSACGARLAADADVCDLCGTPVDAVDLPQVEDASGREPEADASGSSPSGKAVYCNACGWENPQGARFCSQCGEELQDLEASRVRPVSADLPQDRDSDETSEEAPSEASKGAAGDSSNMTRQVGVIVGGALLIVVGLFLATTWSQQVDWGVEGSDQPEPTEAPIDPDGGGSMPPSAAGSAAPSGDNAAPADLQTLVEQNVADTVPEQIREQIATLEEEIAARNGEEKQEKQQELANLYVGAGELGRAALVQQQIAERTGALEDWRRAGDLLYSWMETLQGNEASFAVAEHVVNAYQQVLDQQPGDLDVRTDMATAYLQTNNPMRGVKEINRVLDEDPNHFQARFNKGIMLTMIGRADEAVDQFERVKEIVGSDSPYYQQADQAIEAIRERMRREGDSS